MSSREISVMARHSRAPCMRQSATRLPSSANSHDGRSREAHRRAWNTMQWRPRARRTVLRPMTLRSKLTLMFLGAMQVAFLTAVGTFWAVQSWQLLADDLTVIQEQNLRLERTLEVPVPRAPGEATARQPIHSRTVRSFLALRHHAQTLEEADLIESLGSALGLPSRRGGRRAGERAAPPSSVPDAAGR